MEYELIIRFEKPEENDTLFDKLGNRIGSIFPKSYKVKAIDIHPVEKKEQPIVTKITAACPSCDNIVRIVEELHFMGDGTISLIFECGHSLLTDKI